MTSNNGSIIVTGAGRGPLLVHVRATVVPAPEPKISVRVLGPVTAHEGRSGDLNS
ncbi:MAG: hypothetical protein ACXV3F_02585 [Frankiaceae bacterium]